MSCNNKDLDFIKLTALPPIVEPNKAYLIKENEATFTMYMTDKDCKVYGLEYSGYTLDFNESTNILSLRNAGGVVSQVDLSTLSQGDGIFSVDVDGVTINFRNSDGVIIDSIQLQVSNIIGLQNALDGKEDLTNKVTDLTSPNDTEYPTTQAVYDALQSFTPDLSNYVSYSPQTKTEPQKQQARTNIGVYSEQEIQDFLDGTTSINGYNKVNWDEAYSWGDWSAGVNKAYIDLLNVDADTLDGLDSTDFVTITGAQSVTGDKSFTTGITLPNAVDTGGSITTNTRIAVIDNTGLVNSYVDLDDIFALNPVPPTPSLQEVTEVGNTTLEDIIVNATNVSYPNSVEFRSSDVSGLVFRNPTGQSVITSNDLANSGNLNFYTPTGVGSDISPKLELLIGDNQTVPDTHAANFFGRVKGRPAQEPEDYPTFQQLLDLTVIPNLQQVTSAGSTTDQGLQVTGQIGLDVSDGLKLYATVGGQSIIQNYNAGQPTSTINFLPNVTQIQYDPISGGAQTIFNLKEETALLGGSGGSINSRLEILPAVYDSEAVTLGQLNNGLDNVTITESQITDLKDYLRGDINDTNGANKLTLGSLEVVGQTILQNGLNMSSVPVGTSDNILTLNQTTGDVEQRVFSLGDIDIANAAGTSQFPVGLGDQLRFEGSGDTSISFDGVTNTINITSVPGSGTGGAVTSFNGRTGGVVSETGDYSTAMVNELTNLYFTEPRVRSTPLTGLTVTNTPISATNTFLQALGRLQGQINDREVSFSKNTAFNKNFGTVSGTVLEGDWRPSWSQITGTLNNDIPFNIGTAVNSQILGSGLNTYWLLNSGDLIMRDGSTERWKFQRTTGDFTATGSGIFGGNVTAAGGNSSQWNAAYGWGNHASQGYITGAYTGFDSRYVNISGDNMTGELRVTPNVTAGATIQAKTIQLGSTSEGSFIASGTNAGGDVSYVLRGYNTNGVQLALHEGAVSAKGQIALRAIGTGTGVLNTTRLGFYESNGTVEQGYVGFASSTRSDINVRNFIADTYLQLREEGGVNGLQYIYNGNVFSNIYHQDNHRSDSQNDARYVRANTRTDGYAWLRYGSTNPALWVTQQSTGNIVSFRQGSGDGVGVASVSNDGSYITEGTVQAKNIFQEMTYNNYTSNTSFITNSGNYKLNNGATSTPPGEPLLGSSLLHLRWDDNASKQLFFSYNNDNIYYRREVSGAFTSYVKLYHSGNLNPDDYVTINTPQTITSYKYIKPSETSANLTAGTLTFGATAGSGAFISSSTGSGGNTSFILRGYSQGGVQLELSSGGISANGVITGSNLSGTNTGDQTLSGLGGVPTSRTITAGSGLTGGGNLTANRTLSVDSTVARTNVAETFSSTVTATNFILSSDRKLKENIESLGNGYYTFNFKDDTTKRKRYGTMADEVEQYAPELVYENKEGFKQVAYIDFLIKKIAELENKINRL